MKITDAQLNLNYHIKELSAECIRLQENELKLCKVSNMTVEQLTELFLKGYTLVPPEPYKLLLNDMTNVKTDTIESCYYDVVYYDPKYYAFDTEISDKDYNKAYKEYERLKQKNIDVALIKTTQSHVTTREVIEGSKTFL